MTKFIFLPAAVLVFLFILIPDTGDDGTEKIMPFVNDHSYCLECHSREELNTRCTDPARTCDTFCEKCHKDMDAHHKVGMEVSFKVPGNIFLINGKRLGCISCHDLKNRRFDDKPWKANSLFGRLFERKEKYKTYFLIKNNSKGQLCKACH